MIDQPDRKLSNNNPLYERGVFFVERPLTMLLAFDSYYFDKQSNKACVAFDSWTATAPYAVYSEVLEHIEDYTSGAFYKRELPCILSLLEKTGTERVELIIVDGFVYLDDNDKLGLGGHLYHKLEGKIPVIGVVKSNFATIETCKRAVLRGQSKNPLYVTSIGMEVDEAAEKVKNMSGEYRLPTLLKKLDCLTKEN